MKLAKWGNSLAIRLPASVVAALDLKEGDEVEVRVGDGDGVLIRRDMSRETALKELKALRGRIGLKLPRNHRFDRTALHERGRNAQ